MSTALTILPGSRLLKQTSSRCPRCLATVPAAVHEQGERVVMIKECPHHGRFEVVLARDRRFYHLSHGATSSTCSATSCGCEAQPAAGDGQDPFEVLSTCIALIEIVHSCNLACPTCYAGSKPEPDGTVDCISFEDFAGRVQRVIDRKGCIDILQLSGGEPTIHPEFFRILEWAVDHSEISYVLINTNAVRIAAEADFRERLGAIRRRGGGFELYVQFDGTQDDGQIALRGADLRNVRHRAIDMAGELGVPSTLAMVVSQQTLPFLGDTLRFGLSRPHCRGITFQPIFHSGRAPAPASSLPMFDGAPSPISVGDVILNLVDQAPELVDVDDFTPLPCGDPNCHTIGYLLRTEDGPVGLSRVLDLPALQGFLGDRVDYNLADLARCGCETEPLAELLKTMEIGPDRPFRIFIKPFMDASTYDQDRIDRCCTHVIRPDGRLDSFCRYYLNGGAGGLA